MLGYTSVADRSNDCIVTAKTVNTDIILALWKMECATQSDVKFHDGFPFVPYSSRPGNHIGGGTFKYS